MIIELSLPQFLLLLFGALVVCSSLYILALRIMALENGGSLRCDKCGRQKRVHKLYKREHMQLLCDDCLYRSPKKRKTAEQVHIPLYNP
jgi:hypothetical protein